MNVLELVCVWEVDEGPDPGPLHILDGQVLHLSLLYVLITRSVRAAELSTCLTRASANMMCSSQSVA